MTNAITGNTKQRKKAIYRQCTYLMVMIGNLYPKNYFWEYLYSKIVFGNKDQPYPQKMTKYFKLT